MNKKTLWFLIVCGCQDPGGQSGSGLVDTGMVDGSLDSTSTDYRLLDSNVETDQQPSLDPDAGISRRDGAIVPADLGTPQDVASMNTAGVIWMGPKIVFEKPAFADTASPEAQDQITDAVALTRGDGNVLFNIAVEASANAAISPRGTLWAMGTTEELDGLTFTPLREAANNRMQELPGKDMVLFIVDDNIYIDVRFLTWRSGRGRGGGFSYERSTPN